MICPFFTQLGCLTELIARHGLRAGDDVFRRERDGTWAKARLDGWHEAVRKTIG